MNYFLTHINSPLPMHLIHTLRQIIYVDSSCNITLCTDTNIKFDDSRINVINSNDLAVPSTGDYFRNEIDPLWLTSLLRIFLINAYIKQTKQEIVHFDNDVLLLKNIESIFNELNNEVYITPQTTNTIIFGFSIIKNIEKFNTISETIYNNIAKGLPYILSQTGDHGHEMRLLHHYGRHFITDLPTHPLRGNIQKTIFDPITYGQFLGGTNNGHPPGFIDKDHIVGTILDPDTVIRRDKRLLIIDKDEEFELANLHVHSKHLERFTTYDK